MSNLLFSKKYENHPLAIMVGSSLFFLFLMISFVSEYLFVIFMPISALAFYLSISLIAGSWEIFLSKTDLDIIQSERFSDKVLSLSLPMEEFERIFIFNAGRKKIVYMFFEEGWVRLPSQCFWTLSEPDQFAEILKENFSLAEDEVISSGNLSELRDLLKTKPMLELLDDESGDG